MASHPPWLSKIFFLQQSTQLLVFSGSLDELLLALLSVLCTNDIVNLFSAMTAIESPPLMIN